MKNIHSPKGNQGRISHRTRWIRATLLPLIFLCLAAAQVAPAQPADNRLETARERVSEKRFADAIPLLQTELRDHPENDEARLLLAQVLSWERHFDESLIEYDRLLAKRPTDPTLRADHARVMAWSGRHEEAVREFRAAVAADPTNAETRIGYARALSWSGDLPGASTEYERLLAQNPEQGDPWIGLAAVARWRGAATASDRYIAKAEKAGADSEGVADERKATRAALRPSIGGGWTATHERQYVAGPDFTLKTEGPYAQVRATVARTAGLSARVAWLSLNETPSSGGNPNYDLSSVDYRADLSLLRSYPWQIALGAEYQTFEQRSTSSLYPLGAKDNFFGYSARLWRFSGRLTPRLTVERNYVAIKDTLSGGALVFHPGSIDNYEAALAWQWSSRWTADGLLSSQAYSDDNNGWTAAAGVAYRVKTKVPMVTLDGRLTYRDWDSPSQNYFTPLNSIRGAAGVTFAGDVERPALDYSFRYEFSGMSSSNFDDIWAHSWSGNLSVVALNRFPLGIEGSYTVDNNSYETWYVGLSGSVSW